jgi:hypothetical protein
MSLLPQAPPTGNSLPDWLTSGPIPVILFILIGIILFLLYLNYRLKKVQRDLHTLGKSYYEKEKGLQDRFKSGLMTEREYRREHERLLSEMREDSRRMTDGPPR